MKNGYGAEVLDGGGVLTEVNLRKVRFLNKCTINT
jgi:hypothetical protein